MKPRWALAGALLLAGCGTSSSSTSTTSARTGLANLALSSPGFASGARIPRRYTCDGQDVSPPLRWAPAPRGTRFFALEMQDRNAPDAGAPGGQFIHWIVFGISARARGLSAGQLPSHVRVGRNSFGTMGYRGPCPPRGAGTHHYVITLVAVRYPHGRLGRPETGVGTLVGTYAR